MTGLINIDLHGNYLTGSIPIALMTKLTHLQSVDISHNFFDIDGVTDPDLIAFLDHNFGEWRNQIIVTDFGLTGAAGAYSTGVETGFTITYSNSGKNIS